VGLDGTPRHFQFAGNFGIVTTLQQEVGDLLLSRTQANSLLRHPNYPKSPNTLEIEVGFCDLPFTHARLLGDEKINVSAVSKQRAFEMPYGTIFSSILWTISPGPTSHTTRDCRFVEQSADSIASVGVGSDGKSSKHTLCEVHHREFRSRLSADGTGVHRG
jgi:hypothetical protein